MKKRLLSVVLSAAMAFVGIGAGVWEPVTVYAEENPGESEPVPAEGDPETPEEPVEFTGINIDEQGVLFGDENIPEDAYFQINDENHVEDVTEAAKVAETKGEVFSNYTFRYCRTNHTLTLNKATLTVGTGSAISSDYTDNENGLTISLIGENTVTVTTGAAIVLNGNTKVTSVGSGSLTAKTTCGRVVWVEGGENTPGHYEAVADDATDENGNPMGYYPAAIEIGKNCKRFVNYENTTITAIAENATKKGEPSFSTDKLTCGDPEQSYTEGEVTYKPSGTLVNYGTINGIVRLFECSYNGLVSCKTKYEKPDDHPYIGKAYYFTNEDLYPNNVAGTLPKNTWRVVGKYDENGNPIPSKVYYQFIYKDAVGTVKTEDWDQPMQFLVYEDDVKALGKSSIDEMLTADDVASVGDGLSHTFNTDLYAVWLTDGQVEVNGNVAWDVACFSAPKEEWKSEEEVKELTGDNGYNGEGEMCYARTDGKVQFFDSSESNVTVNGNVGCFSLNESYRGGATINGDIYYCALYKDETFLNAKDESGKVKWIGRWQWQQDNSTDAPEEVYYCAVPQSKAGTVITKNADGFGRFTAAIEALAFADDVKLKGSGLYGDTYFVQTETKKGEEAVAGTSTVVNDNSLLVNVSKTNGLENNTYPIVRKIEEKAEKEIQSRLSNTSNMVAMDIAMIKQTKDEKDEVTAQAETEPTGTVNLYFDRLDLSDLSNPALFHIKDDGNMEKISIVTSGSTTTSASVKCQTNSFSTYVFAEDQTIINPTPSNPSDGGNYGGGSSGGGASSGGATSKPTTETKPDGTKVETSTDTKADGTKVDTTVETKTDGTKIETVVETAKDGSVKTTETVTKADGSATKTEKETEKNTKGKEVAVTTTTEKDASGKVTGITQTSEIAKIAGSASATVTVEKTADGKITSAEAEVDKKGASSKQGVTATLFGSVVSQITEAAGTQAVEISMTVTAGKKEYTVKADAQDLEAGNKLKVLAIDAETGKHVLVNAKTYTVSASGNVKLTLPSGMTYQLMDSKEAAVVEKQILATVKVKKASATVTAGKKTTVQMSKKLDMDNVAKITYSTSKKSVATVSKDGQVTAKKAGSVVITVKVTLNNGKTKNVKMKITVE